MVSAVAVPVTELQGPSGRALPVPWQKESHPRWLHGFLQHSTVAILPGWGSASYPDGCFGIASDVYDEMVNSMKDCKLPYSVDINHVNKLLIKARKTS